MAELSFLGSWVDSWRILGAILLPGDMSLLHDLKYESPRPLYMNSVDDEAKEMLSVWPFFFIQSERFSLFPPYFRKIEAGVNAGKYSIEISTQGPLLEMSLPACYERDGVLKLGPGTVSYQASMLNPETGVWEGPSSELVAGYRDVKARIKRCLVRHKFHTDIWTGRDALSLVKEGKAIITGFGLDVHGK